MQRYDSYKDSGVEWLGEVPSHWSVIRAKRIFREVSEKNFAEAQLLSVTQDNGVIPRDDLKQRVVMPIGQLHTFKLVRKDDFVISLRSFQGGIEYSNYTGLVSPSYTVLRKHIDIHSGYLKYLLKCEPFISEINVSVTGIRQGKNIDFKEMSYSFLPVPLKDEQIRIANFLNEKTAEIDTAIAKKERLIELLKEQKNILINRAVTRGLNPNVAMRDSRVEWIGEIPAHWQIKRLNFFSHVQSGITLGKRYLTKKLSKQPYLRVANVQDGFFSLDDMAEIEIPENEVSSYLLRFGDILMTEGGDIDKLGRGAVWKGEIEKCLHQNHIFAIRVQTSLAISEYIALTTASDYGKCYFTTTANKTTNLASTNKTKLGNFPVVLPSIIEQEMIVLHCRKISSEYERFIQSTTPLSLQFRPVFDRFPACG